MLIIKSPRPITSSEAERWRRFFEAEKLFVADEGMRFFQHVDGRWVELGGPLPDPSVNDLIIDVASKLMVLGGGYPALAAELLERFGLTYPSEPR